MCDARDKLAAEFLRTLIHDVHAKVESDFPDTTEFRGCRVFAVDGCKVNLRRSPELDRALRRPSGGHVPQEHSIIECVMTALNALNSGSRNVGALQSV